MKELFKGFFWPSGLMLLGLAILYLLALLGLNGFSFSELVLLGAIPVVGGSIGLLVRFWGRSRLRAYGVLAGFIAAPLVAYGLFLVFLAVFGRNFRY